MQAILSLAVQDVVLGRVHRVVGGHGQRRDLAVVVQGGLGEGGDARADVERGQGRALREGLLADRGHRVRQCHRRLRRPAEREVADRGQALQLGPEVDPFLGTRRLEGAAAQGDRAAQVDARELVGGAEGAGADRLELFGQGHGGERGEAEGLVLDRAQAVGQCHGGDARLLEGLRSDRRDAVQDRVRASRVLGGRVDDQRRVILGVQDTVNALKVRVRRIDLDAGQRGGLGVARGHRVSGDVGAQLDRGERRVVVEDLHAHRHHGTRQLDGLQARVGERAVGDRGQLGRVGLVVNEGDLLQRAVDEGLHADRTHRSRDRHVFHGGAREGALADGGHGVGQGDLGGRALVLHEDAILVDLEVVGVGGAHRQRDGRGLDRAGLGGDGGGQRARTRVIACGQRRLARVGVGGDRGQVGRLHAPRHRAVLQRGCQVCLHGGGLADLERHLGVGELDAHVLGDGAHADLGASRQGRLGRIGRGDRRLAGGQGADLTVFVHGGHGLVRGRPYEVGDVRVRRLVRGTQRDRLARDDLGVLRGEGQGGHRDRAKADHLAGLVLAPVPGEQVGGRRVGGVRAVDEVSPLDLVVLGVGAVGLTVRAHGLLLVIVATRGRGLGESDAGQRRVVGDVEGHDALVTLAGHRQVGDDGRLGVQGEVPGQLRGNARGRDRGRVDRQLVAARGQLLAILVEAVEDRVVALLAFDGLDLASVVVEQGLAGALEGVLTHDLAGLVRIGVGHLRGVTQQAGARQDARGSLGQRGAGHDEVRGVDRAHVVDFLSNEGIQGTQGHLGRGVHERRGAGVNGARRAVIPLAVEDGRRAPGAVEAHVGDGEVGLTVGAGEGDGAVDERALGSVLIRVRGEGALRGHGDGHGRGALGGHGHRVGGVGQVDALPRPVLGVLGEQATLDDL